MIAGMINSMTEPDEPPSVQVDLLWGDGLEPPPWLSEARMAAWLMPIAVHHQRALTLTARVVSPEESEALNGTYRGKHNPTNVLSFTFEPPPGIEWNDPFVGDLALCADVIDREAREQRKPLEHHWAHMLVHGCLHLLGYDHQDAAEAAVMEALEVRLLATSDIPDPYSLSGDTESG